MKKVSFILLILFSISSYAQKIGHSDTQTFYAMNEGMYISPVEDSGAEFINGKIVFKNTDGSPFLFDELIESKVFFKDTIMIIKKMNYDAVNDDFVFYSSAIKNLKRNEIPFIKLSKQLVKYIALYSKGKKRMFIRINSHLFINNRPHSFFEFFSNKTSNVYIICSYSKKSKLNTSNNTQGFTVGIKKYRYDLSKKYYIMNRDGFYIETKLRKNSIFNILNDRKNIKLLKKYIKKNKLHLKKPKDVQSLLEYYYDVLNKKEK